MQPELPLQPNGGMKRIVIKVGRPGGDHFRPDDFRALRDLAAAVAQYNLIAFDNFRAE